MTEEDTESIWSTALDTGQFDNINVRIGELLNFYLTGDATTDITNTGVLPVLEQISEEFLIQLIEAAKVTGVVIPYIWISANIITLFTQIIRKYKYLLGKGHKVQKVIGNDKTIEIVRRTL